MEIQYNQLQSIERHELAALLEQGLSYRKIGKILGRSHTAIGREVRRNSLTDSETYRALKATQIAKKRSSIANSYGRLRHSNLRIYVRRHLRKGWSPEQISGVLAQEESMLSISHEAIYQWVYSDAPELIPFLRRKRRKRLTKGFSRKRKNQMIPAWVSLSERPEVANQRKEPGHGETDLIVSNASKSALNVTIERISRKVCISIVPNRRSVESFQAIVTRLKRFPSHILRSVTYDNGSENMQHQRVNLALGTKSYFCAPYHSWEKGAVENINGLIREYVPKGSDIALLTNKQVEKIERRLNNRPRKCLGFKTPEQIFKQLKTGALHG